MTMSSVVICLHYIALLQIVNKKWFLSILHIFSGTEVAFTKPMVSFNSTWKVRAVSINPVYLIVTLNIRIVRQRLETWIGLHSHNSESMHTSQ